MITTPSYDTHRLRVVSPDGLVHAARAVGGAGVVLPCPPEAARLTAVLEPVESYRSVTCTACLTVLAPMITCPVCRTSGAKEVAVPIPGTDDTADCARCLACWALWGLDPGSDIRCTNCGGGGNLGRGRPRDPACTLCGEHDQDHHERVVEAVLRVVTPGALVVFVGPGGSGKSTLAAAIAAALPDVDPGTVVSLDELRGRLAGRPGRQDVTPEAVQLQEVILATRMRLGLTTITDSTSVEPHVRETLAATARAHDRPAVAVVLLTSEARCLARNAERDDDRRVPGDTLRWQREQTEAALPLLRGEGYADVVTVDDWAAYDELDEVAVV